MEFAQKIITGQVGILPTDTIFGIVGSALNPSVVERIYTIKGRPENKPFIILVSSYDQLPALELSLSAEQLRSLNHVWPGPNSVIIPCDSDDMTYLHRGAKSIAVRMPDNRQLLELIMMTGPIVATSANLAGQPPANNLQEIRNQLRGLDFYIDGPTGMVPSKIFRLENDGSLQEISRS